MKKVFVSVFIILLVGFLAACGENEAAKQDDNEVKQEENTANETEVNTDEGNEDEEVYFKDNEVKLIDLKIKITDTKVIQPGETGNEYGEKPVFAIWYDTTNLSGKDINPGTAWIAVFEAIQDNDPNAVNTLDVGSLPDEQFLDSQMQTIKKDGTVKNAIAYELDDLETPVTLVASQGVMGEKLGEQTFNLK
ncbi:DUF5067 domain-containing protein [Robertmurraya sp. DFI.2.37]|uniref:DUF5067 domain-containing protein n=1 Tax=Robertmurraya sp. DFI.2.37 TaxID=3031819 RepID=UPI001244A6BD|nr:DUF5067 domain-containing protein [Robertmurraya sp. DFI.2.37]MDF1508904.1 DUF5067 domain-containing protein [Robertmurraya sp. DFI.2.37]